MSMILPGVAKHSHIRRRVALASVLIAVAGALLYMGVVRRDVEAASSAPTIPNAIVTMLGQHHITVAATEDPTAISASEAVADARASNPIVGDAPGSATLVTFSDTVHGTETAADDAASQVIPTYVDREAYAVLFNGVQVPVLGPPDVKATYYTATLVAFVDAHTGASLEAIALNA